MCKVFSKILSTYQCKHFLNCLLGTIVTSGKLFNLTRVEFVFYVYHGHILIKLTCVTVSVLPVYGF